MMPWYDVKSDHEGLVAVWPVDTSRSRSRSIRVADASVAHVARGDQMRRLCWAMTPPTDTSGLAAKEYLTARTVCS